MDKQSAVKQKIKLPEHLCQAEDPLLAAKSYALQLMILTDRIAGSEMLNQVKDWIRTIQSTELNRVLSEDRKNHLVANNVISCITSDLRRLIRITECGYKNKDPQDQSSDGGSATATTSSLEVDSFLFEDLQKALKEQDLNSDRICHRCNSSNVSEIELNFSSHSEDVLINLFGVLLKDLTAKNVLIIGSKEGALAYGAFLFSDAEKIFSYEPNSTLYGIQKQVIGKHNFKTRVEASCIKELREIPVDVISSAHVIIFDDVQGLASNEVLSAFLTALKDSCILGTVIVCKNVTGFDVKLIRFISSLPWLKKEQNCLSSQIFNVYEVIKIL